MSKISSVQARLQSQLRSSIGMRGDPPAPCDQPETAYFDPNSVVRAVHSDLPSMLIGGLASLLFQMLHPLAMAGVAQHSRYQEDPLGRLERTATFLGITTFGSREDAERSIRRIRAIHGTVTGIASDDRPYSANDPDLLTWVHCTEVYSFLTASLAYGTNSLDAAKQDAYIREMATVAYALGAEEVPLSVAELHEYLFAIRPQLAFTDEARVARNFVLKGVRKWPHEVATYATLIAAAQGILPPWARRQLRLVSLPASNRLIVRPLALSLCGALRWIAQPVD